MSVGSARTCHVDVMDKAHYIYSQMDVVEKHVNDHSKRKYKARQAETSADLIAAQKLRYARFHHGDGLDADEFDPICNHVLVEDEESGKLVCCFRFLPLADGSEISRSYSAKYYDLTALEAYPGSMVEMGRFCVHPGYTDSAILRVAWSAMTAYVLEHNVDMLFGCSSFHGTDAETHMEAFTLLKEKHLAPKRWLPRVKAPKVVQFATKWKPRKPDLRLAMRAMPPLLRTYLVMGGWVSDHAVVDPDMNTLHVFTGVEIRRVPEGRARVLRARAG